jgi:formamidopyrimidine-DNA glycosylase
MSGRLLVSGAQVGAFHHPHPAPEKHDHFVLDLEGGARVTLNDARRFGAVDLWPTEALEQHRLLEGLGPEPFGNRFDGEYLAGRLAGRKTPVKAVLSDQRVVAGLGNIYVCEALWRARISPLRLAREVTAAEAEALVAAVRAVLADAIAAGGSSLRDYRRADGELGYFQHAFAVYGREGGACPRGDGVVARVVQSGRSSFFCPACQA